jgi:6-pyruvoyltetrahydropterin/6-carboxytetrahydropterin synthase
MEESTQQFATVAKKFRWDSAHRLPKHDGACRNLHGHSYSMTVEFEGIIGDDGIVVDFQDIKSLVKPLVDSWDHATLVASYDAPLLAAVQELGSKYALLAGDSTAENLAVAAMEFIHEHGGEDLSRSGIRKLTVRVEETITSFAEVSRAI